MVPFTLSRIMPSSLLESMLDFLSRIAKMEATESLALVESGPNALVCETLRLAMVKAKKTCTSIAGR